MTKSTNIDITGIALEDIQYGKKGLIRTSKNRNKEVRNTLYLIPKGTKVSAQLRDDNTYYIIAIVEDE